LTCLQELIAPDPEVSVRHQCELLAVCRSTHYYEACPETPENLVLMRRLDELHLEEPVYGSRKLTAILRREGAEINRKRVVRLLRLMGIEAIYAKPHTSQPGPGHQIYSYLLRDLEVTGPDQVWCMDITYVPMATGFLYLVAVMDWWSRYVLAWRLSNTLEAAFCVDAWEAALRVGRRAPLISNTDQGSQFTSPMFIDAVQSAGVDVSMDGRGRWLDNRFIERLWRSLKYEDIYLQDYGGGLDAGRGLGRWFDHYNQERPHQALGYATPEEVYRAPDSHGAQPATWKAMQPRGRGCRELATIGRVGRRKKLANKT
jgi:putative transposase